MVEELLRSKLEQYGRVNNNKLLISVVYNAKIEKSNVTEDEIEQLFTNVEERYYFSDSIGKDDYEKYDYMPRKGELEFKLIKLNTGMNIYKNELYAAYTYSHKYNTWNGVFIGDLDKVYDKQINYNKTYATTCTEPPEEDYVNTKIKNSLSGLHFDNNGNENENNSVNSNIEIKPKEPHVASKINYANEQRKILAENISTNIYNPDEWENTKDEIDKKIYKYLTYFGMAVFNKLNNKTLQEECYQLVTALDSKKYLIVNSKLLNKYAEWIYIIYEVNEKWNRDKNRKEYFAKDEIYLSNGYDLIVKKINLDTFSLEEIIPIKFYNDKSELIFDAEITDFELELTSYNFRHIIEERRDRLPIALQGQSVMEIAYRIRNSIEYSIKMSKADYNYIIPCYDINRDTIQYMLPLFSSFDPGTKVESVLIVNKAIKKYTVNTVLKVEEAYETARILNRPTASWFV